MWLVRGVGRLFLQRWPTVLVAPALAAVGYTGWYLITLTFLAILLAELAFAVAKVLLLDRE